MRWDSLYIHIALDPQNLLRTAVFADFSKRSFSCRLKHLDIPQVFFSYLTVRIDFFFAVCVETTFPSVFVSSLHRFHIFTACLFEVRRFRNVARSAVARQIDYVLAKGILRRVFNRPSSPFYTCHSRTHPRSGYVVFARVVARRVLLYSVLSSKRLSKNCNALARNPLTIPLLNLCPHYMDIGASRRHRH